MASLPACVLRKRRSSPLSETSSRSSGQIQSLLSRRLLSSQSCHLPPTPLSLSRRTRTCTSILGWALFRPYTRCRFASSQRRQMLKRGVVLLLFAANGPFLMAIRRSSSLRISLPDITSCRRVSWRTATNTTTTPLRFLLPRIGSTPFLALAALSTSLLSQNFVSPHR